MTWRFQVTHEESSFKPIDMNFPHYSTLFEMQVLQMLRGVYCEWLRYMICNMEPWLKYFWVLLSSNSVYRQCKNRSLKRVSHLLIFGIRENGIFISLIHDPLFFSYCELCQRHPCITLFLGICPRVGLTQKQDRSALHTFWFLFVCSTSKGPQQELL